MGFATRWLSEKALFPELFRDKPCDNTGIIVVIPAYDEPDIATVLDSLASCSRPGCSAEVIIIVNLRKDAGRQAILNHRKSIENIEDWKKKNASCFFRLFHYDAGSPAVKNWGVGLARKTGMDEALRRFDAAGNPDGIIVCLDADCTVKENYFTAIEKEFLNRRKAGACSLYFEHPVEDDPASVSAFYGIILYELHLRYYVGALRAVQYPYAFHTVGSAMAVRAREYMRAGGMNRREAGEDFYFIQKLVPSGRYFSLNSTTVYPSPRQSHRVPFGTGATMGKLAGDAEQQYYTYNLDAFRELQWLFSLKEDLFSSGKREAERMYDKFPPGLRYFTDRDEWLVKLEEIRSNTAGYESFCKRFFGWFNMFRIVRFMNSVHDGIHERRPVVRAACDLLRHTGHDLIPDDALQLLKYYRQLDRESQ
ncbi:MAG TPA: glycosyltransferase family A protein [Bacteroidales bacterium]|jgi:hypothetical protein|nr:glycosyltransferase family A protein [Bacteroidales bacterium]HOS71890.1 glycosyltransferase family A protein [Bacteroidales bacterium]HQH22814.1 glycosyltransferase family A protein [Bacteroidales bacterium]HQJ81720.1 glycosyltransferase family A protein [Bacteroidales bacterium]